jgi:hypothetical protein
MLHLIGIFKNSSICSLGATANGISSSHISYMFADVKEVNDRRHSACYLSLSLP